jgi:hypothetical protein
MSSRKTPSYRPAAAIELTWWKHAGADRLGEPHRVARAVDVGVSAALGAGVEIVDRRQVEEVVDLPLELPHRARREAALEGAQLLVCLP